MLIPSLNKITKTIALNTKTDLIIAILMADMLLIYSKFTLFIYFLFYLGCLFIWTFGIFFHLWVFYRSKCDTLWIFLEQVPTMIWWRPDKLFSIIKGHHWNRRYQSARWLKIVFLNEVWRRFRSVNVSVYVDCTVCRQ